MSEWLRRWLVPLAAAGLLAGFLALGSLSLGQALLGAAIIAAAAAVGWGRKAGDGAPVAPTPQPSTIPADVVLEAVIAGLADAAVALDRGGRVLAYNVAMSALAPALRRGEPASVALRTPALVEAIRRAAATNAVQRVEFSERAPAERCYEATVTPIRRDAAAAGLLSLILVTFRDLTPLRQADEMRSDFVANASHELRTPLAALSGFIETLQGPAKDDPAAQQQFLAIMHAQAARMARLIDDLLSLSRIERNAHRPPVAAVDVVPLVRELADGLQTLARNRGVSINVTAPAEAVRVLGDRDELMRAWENLIENALKYAASGERVDVLIETTEASGGPEARVVVRDYGPGIAPEHLPRLTERFYRADVADSRAQGGTGLGLALVKHILNRHRGRLSIVSTHGQGASFTTHLPLLPADAESVRDNLGESAP